MSRSVSDADRWKSDGGGCSPAPGRPLFCSSGFEVSFLSGFVSVNGNLDLAASLPVGDSVDLLEPITSGEGEFSGVDTL